MGARARGARGERPRGGTRYPERVKDKDVLLRAIVPPLLFLAVALGGLVALLLFGEGL